MEDVPTSKSPLQRTRSCSHSRVSYSRSNRSGSSRDRSAGSSSDRRSSYHRGRYHDYDRKSRSRSRYSSHSRGDLNSLRDQLENIQRLLSRRDRSSDSRRSRSRSPFTVKRSHSLSDRKFSPTTTLGPPRDGTGKLAEVFDVEEDLECLGLAGSVKEQCAQFTDPINPDLASNWNLIATSGLSEAKIAEIDKLKAVPSNCALVQAPTLNLELKAGINLSDYFIKRDQQFVAWQTLVAGSLTEIGRAISAALQLKKRMQISTIDMTGLNSQCSSTRQILLHLQHTISTTRRTLVASNLKSDV
ncbi:unnamed protein product [Allacma fusca]|uniref:Uncharacterized protein n=1 Tax=Allacma fusca TaxID=39272 RepID=A0A8J2JBI6_9HEXA|nr:unnamed protein product [Allacma fusca]